MTKNMRFGTSRPIGIRLSKALLAGSAAVLSLSPALAQQAPADAAGDGVEDIVVTARHRTENLQSVPIAITALTALKIEQRDIRSLPDVTRYTPGLILDRGTNANGGSISASVYIRGVGQRNAQPTADPAVGLYIDDIYFGRVVGSVLSVVDAERVEVLRGPQGTLFGKNTLGGAISITSKAPGKVLDGYVDIGLGSYDERNLKAAVDVPVNEKLSARISVSSQRHDGYDPNVLTGVKMGSLDAEAARLVVQWTPTDSLRIRFFADGSREHDTAQAIQPTVIRATSALDPIYADGTRRAFGLGSRLGSNTNDLTTRGAATHIVWDINPDTTLTSITGYRWMKSHVGVDVDGTPLVYNENEVFDKQDQMSQEVRLNGKLLSGRLTWQVGGFFAKENISDLNFITRRVVAALPASLVTIRQRIDGSNKTWALFTQETLHVLDTLSVTAGVRYSHEKKSEMVSSVVTPIFAFVTGFPATRLSKPFHSTTPRFSVDWKPSKDLLVYGSYSKGFKSGGFTYVTIFQTDLSTYKPEQTETWEVGLKADLLDRRLRVNAAAFHTRYKDLQFESFFAPGVVCPSFCSRTLNAAAAKIEGVELEVTAAPAAGLELFSNLAYMHNEVTRVDANALSQVNLNSKLPRTPKWTITVGGSYIFDLGSRGSVMLRGDYSYRSLSYFDFANQPGASQPHYGLINAGISWTTADNRWQFTVSGQNLTNKLYANAGTGATFNSDGYTFVTYGAPRTVTGSIRYRFGAR